MMSKDNKTVFISYAHEDTSKLRAFFHLGYILISKSLELSSCILEGHIQYSLPGGALPKQLHHL